MKKLALILLVGLALPGTALAKGPSKASIAGPGVATIKVSGAEGSSTPFWRLVEATGWFDVVWGPSAGRTSPPPVLGPRYSITWTVPSSHRLRQDLYPYAEPYPVTYMPRRQKIYGTSVKGGWFDGGATLEQALIRIGLPRQAVPSAAPVSDVRAGGIAAAAAFLAVARSLRLHSSDAAGT